MSQSEWAVSSKPKIGILWWIFIIKQIIWVLMHEYSCVFIDDNTKCFVGSYKKIYTSTDEGSIAFYLGKSGNNKNVMFWNYQQS